MRAVAYCRVSTDEKDQLNSLKNQKDHYQELFKKEGFKQVKVGLLYSRDGKIEKKEHIDGIFADEGISGTKSKNREAFKYMLKCAKKREFDVIYVKNVARYARSVEDGAKTLKDLKEYGVKVIFEDGNLNSFDHEMVINMFFSVAQEESRNKSIACQFGVRKAQQAGKWNSQVPFGYRIENGYLQIKDSEIETVKIIFNLFLNHGYGTGKIARYLNERKILTKKGRQWSQPQLFSILDNEIYTGKQVNHKHRTSDVNRNIKEQVDPSEWIITQREELRVISDEEFKLVQLERKKRKNMFEKGNRNSNQHLLSNILYCFNCGSNMKRKKRHSYTNDGTTKDIGYEWTCQRNDMYGKSKCDTRNAMTEEEIIKEIKEKINELYKDRSKFDLLFKMYLEKNYNCENVNERLEEYKIKIETKEKIVKMNLELLTDNIITKEQYKQQNDEIQDDLSTLKSEYNRLLYIDKEIESVKFQYENFLQYIMNIDTDNLTNVILKKIINKVHLSSVKLDNKYKNVIQEFISFMKESSFDSIIENISDESLKEMLKNEDSEGIVKIMHEGKKTNIHIDWNFLDSSEMSVRLK